VKTPAVAAASPSTAFRPGRTDNNRSSVLAKGVVTTPEKGDSDYVDVPQGLAMGSDGKLYVATPPETVVGVWDLSKDASGKTVGEDRKLITPSQVDTKVALHEVLRLQKAGGRRGRKGRMGKNMSLAPIETWLVWQLSSTSAAATALTAVVGLTPANAISWTQWSAIYDEVMVVAFELRLWFQYAGANPLDVWSVVAYDPIDLGALSGISAGSEYSQHKMWGLDFITAPDATVPRITNATGLLEFRGKTPSETQRSSATATTAAGQWMDTADGADAWGYFKYFVEAMGAATTCTVRAQYRARCKFRSRAL